MYEVIKRPCHGDTLETLNLGPSWGHWIIHLYLQHSCPISCLDRSWVSNRTMADCGFFLYTCYNDVLCSGTGKSSSNVLWSSFDKNLQDNIHNEHNQQQDTHMALSLCVASTVSFALLSVPLSLMSWIARKYCLTNTSYLTNVTELRVFWRTFIGEDTLWCLSWRSVAPSACNPARYSPICTSSGNAYIASVL